MHARGCRRCRGSGPALLPSPRCALTGARCSCVLREQTAAVRIKFLRPLPLETFSDNRRLGRFMLRYAGDTVAAGLVKKIMK